MNFYKFLMLSSLTLLLNACGGGNVSTSELFDIQLEGNKKQFSQNEIVGISLKNKKGKTINNVVYTIDGQELTVKDNKIQLNVAKLGNKTIKASIDYEDRTGEVLKEIKILSASSPEIYTYEIINTYPHDNEAFTQGLEFYADTLYESTGKRGSSSLRKVNYKTGEVLNKIDLENAFFGEGITILNDKIYQLTWQSGTGFIYDLNEFKKVGSFKYGQSKEGWGFCNDGKQLYKSDGSEKIWLLDPNTLIEEDFIEIVTNKSIFNKANELEYVAGKIYANVYEKESMMIIDAKSGAIEGVINFGGLKKLVTKGAKWDEVNSVLNGVAYNPKTETFFVTGKYWDKLFEVKLMKK
ncbi:glutamine cyclotransferase [Saonia flava]|uniref:Glutamine cyclotransferase n=1 Tax=Saonia flava TaxID=523696 RepID=A0A846QRI0_9FLAO|nr:glutaminyl-peptide cyclotransferase [Saonia flava]NJB69590.1 glutamine cyclotransferase [Saonia flava]